MGSQAPPRMLVRHRRWHVRGPFSRWPRAANAVLAAVIYVLTVTLTPGPADTIVVRSFGDVPWYAHVLFLAAAVALYWRRTAPLAVAGVQLACWALLLPSDFVDLGGALIVALYSVGRWSDRDMLGEAVTIAGVGAIVADALVHDLPTSELVVGAIVMVGVWTFGRSRRMQTERAEQYLREQEADRGRIVAEERTRIARELHDVVAHRVSLMTIQAGAARAVAARDQAAAVHAMEAVEDAGRQALAELRHLLGVLRPELDEPARDPQPGLADVARLVEQFRVAGLDVEVEVAGVTDDLPAPVGLSAYRIVQEALTNVARHAGDGARAWVRIVGAPDRVRIEVRDDGGASDPATTDTPGHGIIGMRERAALLGGTLDASPGPDGGFLVVAALPIDHSSHEGRAAREAAT